jgi:pimeloyl-ACP methyl ester carboxylesterase
MNHASPLGRDETQHPILLLHSSGLSAQQWRKLVSTLSPQWRVIAHDFLGCGVNPPWAPGQEFELQLELDAVFARLDAQEPIHLVGHSYGGFVALELARRNPDRIASLALYEPTAFGVLDSAEDDDVLDSFLQLIPLFDLSHLPRRLASQRALAGSVEVPLDVQKIPIGTEAWLRAFTTYWAGEGVWSAMPEETRASFLRAGEKVYLEMRAATVDRTPVTAYRALAMPTLLMCGARSPEPTRRIARRLAETMPRACLREFPTAGHLGPITHAIRVNEAIEEHLRTSGSARH